MANSTVIKHHLSMVPGPPLAADDFARGSLTGSAWSLGCLGCGAHDAARDEADFVVILMDIWGGIDALMS